MRVCFNPLSHQETPFEVLSISLTILPGTRLHCSLPKSIERAILSIDFDIFSFLERRRLAFKFVVHLVEKSKERAGLSIDNWLLAL